MKKNARGIPMIYKPSHKISIRELNRDSEKTKRDTELTDKGYDATSKALKDMGELSSDDDTPIFDMAGRGRNKVRSSGSGHETSAGASVDRGAREHRDDLPKILTQIEEAVVKLDKNMKIARAKYTRSREETEKGPRVRKFEADLGDTQGEKCLVLSRTSE